MPSGFAFWTGYSQRYLCNSLNILAPKICVHKIISLNSYNSC